MAYDASLHARSQFAKHLIGSHDQKNHGRDDHKTSGKVGPAVGALAGGLLGGVAGDISGKGKGLGAGLGALLGGLATDQLRRNAPSKEDTARAAQANDIHVAELLWYEAQDLKHNRDHYKSEAGGGFSDEEIDRSIAMSEQALKDTGLSEAQVRENVKQWDLTADQKPDWL